MEAQGTVEMQLLTELFAISNPLQSIADFFPENTQLQAAAISFNAYLNAAMATMSEFEPFQYSNNIIYLNPQ